jgi:4a-hydroxytetrahydrobiopterin dehydratase
MATTYEDLLARPCPPCRAGAAPLDDATAAALLAALGHGWTIVDGKLTRHLRFPDFATALACVDRLGALSDEVDHHPDLHLGWGRVDIAIWSHAAGGLTETDFAWAARAERLVIVEQPQG